MKRRIRRYYPDKIKYMYFIAVALIVTAIICVTTDIRLRPYVKAVAEDSAVNLAMSSINTAIEEVIAAERVTYDMLAIVDRDGSGRVTSVKTDALKMNLLKSKVGNKIKDRIDEIKEHKIYVPLGVLLGSDLWSGMGPKISSKISLYGNVVTDITSEFKSSGINQTIHRIVVKINANISVMLPSFTTEVKVSTSMCIAETVIVGIVPNTSAQIVNG